MLKAMKKESVKREKKVRAGVEAVAEQVETPVTAEPTEASVASPEVETKAVAECADIPAAVEGALAPAVAPAVEAPAATEPKAAPAVDLEALRTSVEEAKAALDAAQAEMKRLVEHARVVATVARDDYRKALAPYRDACKKAGHPCEFEGGRGANVAARVGFLVERTAEGVCITIRGRPETVETIPLSALKESVGKVGYSYCDRWLGPKEVIGNKGGGLGNRIRAVLK